MGRESRPSKEVRREKELFESIGVLWRTIKHAA